MAKSALRPAGVRCSARSTLSLRRSLLETSYRCSTRSRRSNRGSRAQHKDKYFPITRYGRDRPVDEKQARATEACFDLPEEFQSPGKKAPPGRITRTVDPKLRAVVNAAHSRSPGTITSTSWAAPTIRRLASPTTYA
jgi:hypothetical protein